MECFFCDKAAGRAGEPLGGYVYRDDQWIVNHTSPRSGMAGTLIASSRRHFLDATEMSEEEAAAFSSLQRRLIVAVKEATDAERVYTVAMMANVPHFHTWFIPQPRDSAVKAIDLLASERQCREEDVVGASLRIREVLERS